MTMRPFLVTALLLAVASRLPAREWQDETAERIGRVERGLRPPVLVRGEPGGAMILAERMRHYRVPGVSVAVIHRGRVDWARGYGVVDETSGRPVTPRTLFQAASISKPLAAFAVMQLIARRDLDLDVDINRYLRSWQLPANQFTETAPVTLRRVLSHSAGLADWAIGGGWSPGEALPSLPQLLDGATPQAGGVPVPARVVLPVNTRWRYSNFGYAVVQLLLEDITGEPFARFMRDALLGPLELSLSTFEQPLPESRWAEAATAHNRNGQPLAGRWRVYPAMAPSGLWTTPTELARFAIEVQRATAGTSSLLPRDQGRAMVSRQIENTGMGVNLRGTGPTLSFAHGGSNAGFRAYLVAFVERGQGAVVMANGAAGDELINEILRSIAHEYGWPFNGTRQFESREVVVAPGDPARFSRLTGRYEFERFPGTFLSITLERDTLWGRIGTNPARFDLLRQSDSTYVMRNGWNLAFITGPDGKAREVRLDNGRAVRVP